MAIPLSVILQSLGLWVAAKALNVRLNLVMAVIVIALSTAVVLVIGGLIGLLVGLLVYCVAIKYFDKECDYFKLLGLFFIGLAVQKGLIELVVEPLILHSFSAT